MASPCLLWWVTILGVLFAMAMVSLIKGRFDAAGAIGTGPEVERDGSKRLANKKRAIMVGTVVMFFK